MHIDSSKPQNNSKVQKVSGNEEHFCVCDLGYLHVL